MSLYTEIYNFILDPAKNTALAQWSNISVHTIQGTSRVSQGLQSIYYYNDVGKVTLRNPFKQDIAVLSLVDIKAICDFIDKMARLDYTTAMNDDAWKATYQIEPRAVARIVGTTSSPSTEWAGPCHYCGYVLPTRMLTVDHQQPQTGGVYSSIAKVLRMIPGYSLTASGPSGIKGTAVKAIKPAAVPTKGKIFKDIKKVRIVDSYTKINRYSLSDTGTIFFTVADYAAKITLQNSCMSNLLNLTPLCGSCNSSKSNFA